MCMFRDLQLEQISTWLTHSVQYLCDEIRFVLILYNRRAITFVTL